MCGPTTHSKKMEAQHVSQQKGNWSKKRRRFQRTTQQQHSATSSFAKGLQGLLAPSDRSQAPQNVRRFRVLVAIQNVQRALQFFRQQLAGGGFATTGAT